MLIKNSNTHIAHGLKPSTKPITTARIGKDTFWAFISPRIGTVMFSSLLELFDDGSSLFSLT